MFFYSTFHKNRFFSHKRFFHLTKPLMKSKKKQQLPFTKSCDYSPKTPNQTTYLQFIQNNSIPIVFGIGPAGSGKTLLPCVHAIKLLKDGHIDKIVITRPIVAVEEEDIGFLPGNINKKMDPWTRPIFDIFKEYYSQNTIHSFLQSGKIEISPLAYMRGRTFKNSFIIADEMQNSTPNQMLMLTTRIGDNSKMVITGDLNQTDRSTDNNGLSHFIQKFNFYILNSFYDHSTIPIKTVFFKNKDIQRSPIVSQILDIYTSKFPINNTKKHISNTKYFFYHAEYVHNNRIFNNFCKPLVNSNGTFEVSQGSDTGKEMDIQRHSCSDLNFLRYKPINLSIVPYKTPYKTLSIWKPTLFQNNFFYFP